MELGQRLKQARQEAGLSQRQVCGDTITRNMLSQIENGSARPSMDTLLYLARQLGKPVSYFFEETSGLLPNQAVIEQARSAEGAHRLELLAQYQPEDPVFDPERYLLEAIGCMELAQQVMDRPGYARELLRRAGEAGRQSSCYTPELERRRLLLCYRAGMDPEALVAQLPSVDQELLLRAEAALKAGNPERASALLSAAGVQQSRWFFLMGETQLALGNFDQAVKAYQQAEDMDAKLIYSRLERCYEGLGDYKQAYEYACRQR